MARKKIKRINSSYYTVALIDLMGQQEQLRALKIIPDSGNAEEHAVFISALNTTYRAVVGM